MIFSDRGVQTQPQPTMDGNAVAEAFDKETASMHIIPVAGGYDAIERADLSLRTLQKIAAAEAGKPGRKLLIWIGPGWPMLEGARYVASNRSQTGWFNGVVEISQQLREARITLYAINAIDPGSSGQMMRKDFYKDFLKPPKSPHEMQFGNLSVPVFRCSQRRAGLQCHRRPRGIHQHLRRGGKGLLHDRVRSSKRRAHG